MMQIEYRDSGYEAWKDSEPFAKPNLKAILFIIGFILSVGCGCGLITVNNAPKLFASLNPSNWLRVPGSQPQQTSIINPESTEEPTPLYGVNISEALPTYTPSLTPTLTPTPTATINPTIDYEGTLQVLEATNEALLSATPKPDIEATRQAIQAAYEFTPEIVPTIAPVYEGYGRIIHNRTIIRSAPGQQYAPLYVESDGTVFPVLNRLSSGWTRIRMFDGGTGYVRSDLIAFTPDDSYQPPQPTPRGYIEISQSTPVIVDLSKVTPNANSD